MLPHVQTGWKYITDNPNVKWRKNILIKQENKRERIEHLPIVGTFTKHIKQENKRKNRIPSHR